MKEAIWQTKIYCIPIDKRLLCIPEESMHLTAAAEAAVAAALQVRPAAGEPGWHFRWWTSLMLWRGEKTKKW